MKNTKANRQKFLQGYLKILLSWKNKKQDVVLMKNALEEFKIFEASFIMKRIINVIIY